MRFVMNSELDGKIQNIGPGWMHLLDLPGDGSPLGCNMPPPRTVGPLIRYSTRQTRSMLLTDARGTWNTEREISFERKCRSLYVVFWAIIICVSCMTQRENWQWIKHHADVTFIYICRILDGISSLNASRRSIHHIQLNAQENYKKSKSVLLIFFLMLNHIWF